MSRLGTALAAAATLLAQAAPATAHPMPFSTLDVHLHPDHIDVALTAHAYDLAHDLAITPSARLLDPLQTRARAAELVALLAPRLTITADGRPLTPRWSPPEVVPDRQGVRLPLRLALSAAPALVAIEATLFPYDPDHQTFVNLYQGDRLITQAIVDRSHPRLQHLTGVAPGIATVVRRFAAAGVHHILIGWDHLLFLVGLLLLGGHLRQLVLVVSAFTLGHSVTLSLAVLGLATPPARLIEPAIALSIVFVGADNLLARPGARDARPFFALAFGLIHGFGFASVLRESGLPARGLGWALFSFNLGVELGQLLVVLAVAAGLAALRARSERAGRRLAVAGSWAVAAAGAFWFIERVFFSGGTS